MCEHELVSESMTKRESEREKRKRIDSDGLICEKVWIGLYPADTTCWHNPRQKTKDTPLHSHLCNYRESLNLDPGLQAVESQRQWRLNLNI